jgi:glycosyltransferase involved in cell wall biosynthesis
MVFKIRFILFILILFNLNCNEPSQTIAIVTGKIRGAKPWDPDSIHSGITGSEEAVIYISQKLAKLGHQVIVFADIPQNSRHSLEGANPRFVDFSFNDGEIYDVAVAWRLPQIAKFLKTRAREIYFWPHDLCFSWIPESDILGFDDVLWISRSQREQWISINPAFNRFSHIYGNGINPEQFGTIQKRSNPYSCIYASSYDRGLEVLLNIWPKVKKQYPRAVLDIYYGWPGSTSPSWTPAKEGKLRAALATLAFLDVREHGLVNHETLAKAYESASFWTYPCTALPLETFCISALKAQFAGAVPVVIKGSALNETVPHGYFCLEEKDYLSVLLEAMGEAEKISEENREKQRAFILEKYTWEKIALQWSRRFAKCS